MRGRTCVITGATRGIGLAAARALAARGATLVLVGRDPDRTERAVSEVRAATGNQAVRGLVADLASRAAVEKLAGDILALHEALHVLVNNAGAMFTSRHESPDGLEMTFALNHMAYFLLTRELLPALERGAGEAGRASRIVAVASSAHHRGHLDFDDLQSKRGFSAFGVYANSKLANVLFARELARRLGDRPVTVNAVHPGFVRSGFGRNDAAWMKAAIAAAQIFARSPDKGAEGIVHLATSGAVEGVTGRYWMDRSEKRPSPEAQDDEVAKRLWEETERLAAGGVSGGAAPSSR